MTHVVMLVTNDVSTDTRVKKEALAVARMGLTVTVLGTTTESHRWETMLGDVRILRVPVEFTLRNERVRRRNERRRGPLATALAKRTTQPALAGRPAAAPPAAAPPGSVAGAGGADAPGVTGVRPGLPGLRLGAGAAPRAPGQAALPEGPACSQGLSREDRARR